MHDALSFFLADALAARPAPAGGEWQLPPLVPSGQLTPATLLTVAKAYLFAELESSGLIACADAVAESRASLHASYGLAARIERYVDMQRHAPTSLEREAFFVRWFGLGRNASMDERGNHAFFPRMSDLCGALATLAASGVGAPPRSFGEERARAAMQRLLAELSLLAGGDLIIVSRIEHVASSAAQILADPELASRLGVTGFLAVVRALVGGVAVDLATAYSRGRSGQAVLEDCSRLMPRAPSNGDVAHGGRPFVDPTDPVVTHAIQWLASYGILGSKA